ncbi:MAG: hypothetical protein KIT83_10245 [Bryobacterales bacterium]|nr:hypothetical protein [Bryobacterales bacterium]
MSQSQTYWRSFPSVERLYSDGQLPNFLARCEQSCQALDTIIRQGDEREAERARAAMTAYGHTLQLLDHLAGVLAGNEENIATH